MAKSTNCDLMAAKLIIDLHSKHNKYFIVSQYQATIYAALTIYTHVLII
jgi:hypothetical protein